MATHRLYLRIALIALGFCYALSINENEFLMKRSQVRSSGLLRDEEISKRESRANQISEETQTDNNDLRLNRRQMPCCTVAPSSCNVNSPYRTMDGTCNNLANPCWGSAGNPFVRVLPPQYANGISTPRGSSNNPPLPRPRDISSRLAGTVTPPSVPRDISLMVMQWGQFCDHDMTFAPEDNVTNCCNGSTHASCLPINVTGDSFYKDFNVTCLPFVRSTATTCPTGLTREQMNARTAFLDASQVYGSSDQEMNTLRVTNSYFLKFDPGEVSCAANNPSVNCRTFLPTRANNMTGNTEFFAGDARLEQQPGLTSMHTIFLRLHNDFSDILERRNPSCSNDIIFQETRKIIGALMQQITFNEFLPATLGRTVMNKWGLLLGNFPGYNSSLNPSTFNVFATASFRFGHSLVRNIFTLPTTSVSLAESFNNHARTTFFDTLPSHFMRGIAFDPSEPMDHIIADAVRNKLFARQPFTNGEDLFSRNIQRGRDHGIPSYRNWINNYFPGEVNSFSDLSDLMPTQVVEALRDLYGGRLDDLDLFPVAIAEDNLDGSLLGPTFANINGEYFNRLKYGDRFWFENGIFRNGQLQAIYDTKLSHIICLCTNAPKIQEWVMQLSNTYNNPQIDCDILIKKGVVDFDALWFNWGNLCPSLG